MGIAIVTGASSGMGREFVQQIDGRGYEEIWIIARRKERLEALASALHTPVRILTMDLFREESYREYQALLEQETPRVELLVNASGFGKFGRYDEITTEDSLGMIDLNCRALVRMTTLTLPYVANGGHIIQVDSLSAFQPVPYLTVYAATKAFVLSYARGLNAELRDRQIHVMAFCPGWVKTEFFDHAEETSKSAVTYFNILFEPADVVRTALRDSARGKGVCVPDWRVKLQVLGVKLLPNRLVTHIWMRQQKHL